ncbi:uncharacterized protein QC761_102445 [Podospora bellae-mahoneyi]|uniref:Uncharacterized protein n=1 Tax=Podospora bellae-mahoneyi TaxID=2093777 RepID=A0ABR0FVQ0_9PEZI|nr:hypothetical protein QC761_102445 [Podospora bellae-mahoneyi]
MTQLSQTVKLINTIGRGRVEGLHPVCWYGQSQYTAQITPPWCAGRSSIFEFHVIFVDDGRLVSECLFLLLVAIVIIFDQSPLRNQVCRLDVLFVVARQTHGHDNGHGLFSDSRTVKSDLLFLQLLSILRNQEATIWAVYRQTGSITEPMHKLASPLEPCSSRWVLPVVKRALFICCSR